MRAESEDSNARTRCCVISTGYSSLQRRWRLRCVRHTVDLRALYDLAEEQGEHVRLDWKGEEAPSNKHDGRAAAASLALKIKLDHDVLLPILQGRAHQPPDQPPEANYTSRCTDTSASGTCGFTRGFWSRLERTIELTKSQLLDSKTGCLGALPMTSRWNYREVALLRRGSP